MKTKRPQSIRFAALLALAVFAVAPQAVSQQMLAVLMAKHRVDFKGNGLLTDSFDSGDFWKSNFGQYDPSVYAGDTGDVVSSDGVISTISVGNAKIYGKVHTRPGGTVTVNQGAVGCHAWQAAGNIGFQAGYVLQDATNYAFSQTSLPYSAGLPLGGPQIIVTVTYLNTTNAIYTTNYYDHVMTGGDYYCWIGDLHGSTIVLGDARLVVPDGLAMSGIDQITVAPSASLKMYAGGTFCTVGGNGILNLAGYAEDFILECIDHVTNFVLNCNGEFIGVLVAPEADMTFNGGGHANNDFIGAAMMKSITMNGHFSFHYDEALSRLPGSPPWITAQPQSRSVSVGQPAAFTVSATGSPPLSYQWQFGGADIPSATNSSFTIFCATTNDAGTYSVIVTNSFGSATSSNAVFVVNVPPTLALQRSAGCPLLGLSGMLSSNFLVQYSTNLAGSSWTDLLSLTNLPSSPYLFVDPACDGEPARFYRAFMQ